MCGADIRNKDYMLLQSQGPTTWHDLVDSESYFSYISGDMIGDEKKAFEREIAVAKADIISRIPGGTTKNA